MPPEEFIARQLLNINNVGEISVKVLYLLIGVDKIENTEEATKFFWENAPKAILQWHKLPKGSKVKLEVAKRLFNKDAERSGIEAEEIKLIDDLATAITRCCTAIVREARIKNGITGSANVTEGQIKDVMEHPIEAPESSIENDVIDEDEIRRFFPGAALDEQ